MIYFAEAVGIGNIKIGHTDKDDALERLAELQTGCPVPLRLLGVIPGTLDDEKDLHRRFASAHVTGAGKEWFKPTPEITSLIPSGEPRKCGETEVIARSVQIKVLTVGRKQFSKSLLNQLPAGDPFAIYDDFWKAIYGPTKDLESVSKRFVIAFEDDVDYWGWIQSDYAIYLVFECEGILQQCRIPTAYDDCTRHIPSPLVAGQTNLDHETNSRNSTIRKMWARDGAKYLGNDQQLYIGV